VNSGYHELENVQMVKAQGRRVRELTDLIRAVDAAEDEFIVFETPYGQRIVVDRQAAADRAEMILRRYGVPADRSADLKTKSRG